MAAPRPRTLLKGAPARRATATWLYRVLVRQLRLRDTSVLARWPRGLTFSALALRLALLLLALRGLVSLRRSVRKPSLSDSDPSARHKRRIMGGLLSAVDHRPTLITAPDPIKFTVRKEGSKETEQTTLEAFLKSRCPSLALPFYPARWLPNGHAQTAYCVLGDFSQVDKVIYDRTMLRLMDGGTIGLDFTPPSSENRVYPEDTPVIVTLHGLTGGSHESYVRAILAPAITPVEQGGLGYRAVVVNFRGRRDADHDPQLYSAGHTDDIRQALMYISTVYPQAPLLGLGFSLGANVLTRYLAEEGAQSLVAAGCILGCPWDLVKNNAKLNSSWFYRTVYSMGMGQNLVTLLKRHIATLAAFPDAAVTRAVPALLALPKPTITDFDNTITRLAGGSAPPFPFPDAHAYYVWASSHHTLPSVRVPLLALNAADDPVVRALPAADAAHGTGWVALAVTARGGHLGWFEAGAGVGSVRRWVRRPVLEWLRATGAGLVRDADGERTRPRVRVREDGWVVEDGREGLGCRALAGTDLIVGVEGEGGLLAGL